MSAPVANPLTLVMAIKSAADSQSLKGLLEGLQALPPEQNPIHTALTKIATVHFARFVFLGERELAVITTYDGDFEPYLDGFINEIGEVFDKLLAHIQDAPPLPVSQHRAAFLQYVKANDRPCVGSLYCAYPNLKVLDILTLEKNQGERG